MNIIIETIIPKIITKFGNISIKVTTPIVPSENPATMKIALRNNTTF